MSITTTQLKTEGLGSKEFEETGKVIFGRRSEYEAFCDSNRCTESYCYKPVLKKVSEDLIECPDCKSILFWMRKKKGRKCKSKDTTDQHSDPLAHCQSQSTSKVKATSLGSSHYDVLCQDERERQLMRIMCIESLKGSMIT